jgi:hypothetical protein
MMQSEASHLMDNSRSVALRCRYPGCVEQKLGMCNRRSLACCSLCAFGSPLGYYSDPSAPSRTSFATISPLYSRAEPMRLPAPRSLAEKPQKCPKSAENCAHSYTVFEPKTCQEWLFGCVSRLKRPNYLNVSTTRSKRHRSPCHKPTTLTDGMAEPRTGIQYAPRLAGSG